MDIPKENCPKCNGEGAILHGKLELADYVCPHCKGEKKLDWVEVVMGKKHPALSYQETLKKFMDDHYNVGNMHH